MTAQPHSAEARSIIDQIKSLGDDSALYGVLDAAHQRLTRRNLTRLARLLAPVIDEVLAREDARTRQLVIRAATFTPTRAQPRPVRYSVDSLYLPLAARSGREWQEKLTVPAPLAQEADGILRIPTGNALGGLLPGEELYLQLPE
ncbi:hypothetical protein OG413_44685 [Streptomyces sp. NBC_01433]|uniref:hypothetical protein n=1 Tax=Streptomyces sp. NBC_01433 TaxID=2903864 RepID=UPI00224E981F|nr:hypothetical protein [Streptomyces sp. NBC_01433]MCX4682282.1 hypothetical protein [Streptomyces sp. NBC_01433]